MRLAAPGQLVGVSYLARSSRTSVLADRARDIPTVRATAESILDLRPDLVVFDSAAHANVKRLVRAAGVRILELPWAASLEEAGTLIARMADVLGRNEQGRVLIGEMRERRRQLECQGPPTATALLRWNRPLSATDDTGCTLALLRGLLPQPDVRPCAFLGMTSSNRAQHAAEKRRHATLLRRISQTVSMAEDRAFLSALADSFDAEAAAVMEQSVCLAKSSKCPGSS